MRILNFEQVSDIQSPIVKLLNIIHQPLIRLAPEAAKNFDENYNEFTIEITNNTKFEINIDTDNRLIRLSYSAVEYMWVTGYAHFKFYQEIYTKYPGGTEVHLLQTEGLVGAFALLSWGLDRLIKNKTSEWPEKLPQPIDLPPKESDENVADEFCLGAIGCLLHHELAHVLLEHPNGSVIENEADADNTSWDWIIPSGFDLDSAAGKKRILMITHAYLQPVILGIHKGTFKDKTHPLAINRLGSALDRFNLDDNHIAYSFATAILNLHLSNPIDKVMLTPGVPKQTKEYDSFKESLHHILDHLSQFEREREEEEERAKASSGIKSPR